MLIDLILVVGVEIRVLEFGDFGALMFLCKLAMELCNWKYAMIFKHESDKKK